jgi:hypothetical protein
VTEQDDVAATPQAFGSGSGSRGTVRLHPNSPPEVVRQHALDVMMEADQKPDGSRFWRYDRMLQALHDAGWRPNHPDTDPGYLRWCEWPDCMRSFNILDGPNPARDGKGWIYVRTGMHVLLCPDHVARGHRPQRFEWQPGDTTIATSCECGSRGEGLTPTTNERCTTWWREHVRWASLEDEPLAEGKERSDP